jgi:hypothetical protein
MSPNDFITFRAETAARQTLFVQQIAGIPTASAEVESTDHSSDGLAEAIFLRAFIAYESSLDALFFHYVTGGVSAQGRAATSYLQPGNELVARRMVKAGFRFLSWAKPEIIRETSKTYIENGWPLADMMSANSQELADCERVRNKIAHNSVEALAEFNIVQRNLYGTERLFSMSPGQLLRTRRRSSPGLQLERYIKVMRETVEAIIDPPL